MFRDDVIKRYDYPIVIGYLGATKHAAKYKTEDSSITLVEVCFFLLPFQFKPLEWTGHYVMTGKFNE